MNYQLMERDAFQVVGVKESLICDGETGPSQEIGRFWAQVGQDGTVDRLLGLNNGQISGLMGVTVDYSEENNKLEYWVATESRESPPDGLFSYEVPTAKWAIFEVVGPVADVLPKTWQQIYSEWFPSNDYEHNGTPSLEVYKSLDPTSPTAKSEIWVPVK